MLDEGTRRFETGLEGAFCDVSFPGTHVFAGSKTFFKGGFSTCFRRNRGVVPGSSGLARDEVNPDPQHWTE